MPFPAAITIEVGALNTAIAAAMPLEAASRSTITALSTQADTLVNDIDAALLVAADGLNVFAAPVMAPAMVLAFLVIVDDANTQLALADLASVAGRVASNLTNG
jgi:hypothetical protein